MSNHNTIIEAFAAENLLGDSHIFNEITNLKSNLNYVTDGEKISFADYFQMLRRDVDRLPRLRLECDIAPQGENHYQLQLVNAIEKVNDDCDALVRRVIAFEALLQNALGAITTLKTSFCSWFALAASEVIVQYKVKFPAAQVKQIAESEFSRLLAGTDSTITTMSIATDALKEEIKGHKKTQHEKFEMGKQQVNTTWTSQLPVYGAAVSGGRADQLLDEDESEVLPFKSKATRKAEHLDGNPLFESREDEGDEPEIKGTFHKVGVGQAVTEELSEEEIEELDTPFKVYLEDNPPANLFTPEILAQLKTREDEANFVEYVENKVHEFPAEPKLDELPPASGCIAHLDHLFPTSQWSDERLMELAKAEDECGPIMACSPEILEASGGDPNNLLAIHDTAMASFMEIAQAKITAGMAIPDIDLDDRRAHPRSDTVITRIEDVVYATSRRPLASVEEVESFINDSPVATPIPVSPRKKVVFLDDDEDL